MNHDWDEQGFCARCGISMLDAVELRAPCHVPSREGLAKVRAMQEVRRRFWAEQVAPIYRLLGLRQ